MSSMIAVDNGLDHGQQFPTADMNSIHEKYLSLLQETGVKFDSKANYKPHIKNVLLENTPEIEFLKRGPKPEIVFTKATKERMLAQCYDKFDIEDEMDFLFKTSVIIRKEIDSMKDWQFTGTVSDFETPRKLNQLMT